MSGGLPDDIRRRARAQRDEARQAAERAAAGHKDVLRAQSDQQRRINDVRALARKVARLARNERVEFDLAISETRVTRGLLGRRVRFVPHRDAWELKIKSSTHSSSGGKSVSSWSNDTVYEGLALAEDGVVFLVGKSVMNRGILSISGDVIKDGRAIACQSTEDQSNPKLWLDKIEPLLVEFIGRYELDLA